MRFRDIENIWAVDLDALSNADRGRVFYQRAMQIVTEALADPAEREQAVRGVKFKPSYLLRKIGAQPAVSTQNPMIRQLLIDVDRQLAVAEAKCASLATNSPKARRSALKVLEAQVALLDRQIALQAMEITRLRELLPVSRTVG